MLPNIILRCQERQEFRCFVYVWLEFYSKLYEYVYPPAVFKIYLGITTLYTDDNM